MRADRLVALSGVLAVALFIAAFAVGGETPDADASVGKIVSFYRDNAGEQKAAGVLLAYASLFLLVFTATVAGALRRAYAESGLPSALAFAGGIVLSVGWLIFAGLEFTLGDAPEKLAPSAVQALNALNSDMFFPVALGTAAFLVGSGIGIVRTRVLPAWLGWAALVIGVVAATPAGFFAIPALGVWILIASALLFLRGRRDVGPGVATTP